MSLLWLMNAFQGAKGHKLQSIVGFFRSRNQDEHYTIYLLQTKQDEMSILLQVFIDM